jgi:hypothetical protein
MSSCAVSPIVEVTGFPVDHGWLRRELGPEVRISGGPSVMLVKDGPVSAIRNQVRDICESGIMEGGKFILIAANNMAPSTPVEHEATVRALVRMVRRHEEERAG